MTETDTSREAVERDAGYWEGWAADIRANNGSVADAANMDAICARYRALLARAEKAEAERDDLLALHGEDMALCNQLEAERDTAWNDAIEAAAQTQIDKANYWSSLCNDDERCHYEAITREILALKKGDTT